MKCPACGKDVSTNLAKCPYCGSQIPSNQPAPKASQTVPKTPQPAPTAGQPVSQETLKCPNCGKEHIKGAYKCLKCGVLLSTGEALPTDPSAPRDLCPFCGKEVVKGASKCRSCGKTILHGQTVAKPATAEQKPPAPGQPAQRLVSLTRAAPAAGVAQPSAAKPGQSQIKIPTPGPEEDTATLSLVAEGLAFAGCLAGLISTFLYAVLRVFSVAAIPAGIGLILGIVGLVLNQMRGPMKVKVVSIGSIVIALFGLVMPTLTFFAGLPFFAFSGLSEIYNFLNRSSGKGVASGVVFVAGMGFFGAVGLCVMLFGDVLLPVANAEAKRNLIVYQALQTKYFEKNHRYAANFQELDWKPGGQKNYAYYMTPVVYIQPLSKSFSLPERVEPDVSESGFLFAAVGNIDKDDALDVWTIKPDKRPYHQQKDD